MGSIGGVTIHAIVPKTEMLGAEDADRGTRLRQSPARSDLRHTKRWLRDENVRSG